MSGKRKPFLHSPKDSSSSSDEDIRLYVQSSQPKGQWDSLPKSEIASTSSASTDQGGASADFYDDNIASPSNSSTSSGPVYVRPPGYKYHGQEITVKSLGCSKGKKKKAFLSSDSEIPVQKNPVAATLGALKCKGTSVLSMGNTNVQVKPKTKREPLPMKLRALPQSFWQPPNLPSDVSPGQLYTKLPPLISKDSQDVADIRPISPPKEDNTKETEEPNRIVKVYNTDWLYKLFNGLDGSVKIPTIRRGRPKKVAPSTTLSKALKNDDPCLGSALVETLLPSVSQEKIYNFPTLTMVSLRDRNKSVSLPALHIERNYSQLLSELVVKL